MKGTCLELVAGTLTGLAAPDGTITKAEWCSAMSTMLVPDNVSQVLFAKMCLGPSHLDVRVPIESLDSMLNGPHSTAVHKKCFELFDDDSQGYVNSEELTFVRGRTGMHRQGIPDGLHGAMTDLFARCAGTTDEDTATNLTFRSFHHHMRTDPVLVRWFMPQILAKMVESYL